MVTRFGIGIAIMIYNATDKVVSFWGDLVFITHRWTESTQKQEEVK